MPKIISNSEISIFLSDHPHWQFQNDCLIRMVNYQSYAEFQLINYILKKITDQFNHHPQVDIRFNEWKVVISLTTHELGENISDLDLNYAQSVDQHLGNSIVLREEIKVKIKTSDTERIPRYATIGSSGADVIAFPDSPIELLPFERTLVPTGIWIEIPEGYEIQIRPRSGISSKYGITLPNTPATIDSDYRGEIKVPLINLSKETFIIKQGMKIAQMILSKTEKINWELVTDLSETSRNSGGFGHTGI